MYCGKFTISLQSVLLSIKTSSILCMFHILILIDSLKLWSHLCVLIFWFNNYFRVILVTRQSCLLRFVDCAIQYAILPDLSDLEVSFHSTFVGIKHLLKYARSSKDLFFFNSPYLSRLNCDNTPSELGQGQYQITEKIKIQIILFVFPKILYLTNLADLLIV